jgi:hypothetical protein
VLPRKPRHADDGRPRGLGDAATSFSPTKDFYPVPVKTRVLAFALDTIKLQERVD